MVGTTGNCESVLLHTFAFFSVVLGSDGLDRYLKKCSTRSGMLHILACLLSTTACISLRMHRTAEPDLYSREALPNPCNLHGYQGLMAEAGRNG